MTAYFSERLERIIDLVFNAWDKDLAWQGKAELEEIVEEGGADCADAYALLARIYSGPQFTWVEADFPEDDQLAYKYLHESVRRGSAVGLLQALRTSGAMTPTLEKELPMTPDQAFVKVKAGALAGSAYCQYAIGNVYYWGDFKSLPSARKQLSFGKNTLFSRLKQKVRRTWEASRKKVKNMDLMSWEAMYWLEMALESGFSAFPGNLRNLYREAGQEDKERQLIDQTAEMGNPAMLAAQGNLADEAGDFQTAFDCFQKGAEKNNLLCLVYLGDYYLQNREELRGRLPYNPDLALTYYERAVKRWRDDAYLAGYAMMNLLLGSLAGYGHRHQDWGKMANLADMAEAVKCLPDILPYLGYMTVQGKGRIKDLDYGAEILLKAKELEEKRAAEGPYQYATLEQALWRIGLGYAYEQGFGETMPDYDLAVRYYQEASELTEAYLDYFGPDYHQAHVENEAAQRLAYFEQEDGHWQLRAGFSQSSANGLPPAWPQNANRFYKSGDEADLPADTSFFDWPDVEESFDREGHAILFTYAQQQSLGRELTEIYRISLLRDREEATKAKIYLYGFVWENNSQADDSRETEETRYPIRYGKTMSCEEALEIFKDYFDRASLERVHLADGWKKEYRRGQAPYDHYLLEVDGQTYLLDEYEDSNQMVLDSLEGLREGRYQRVFVRTNNDVGASFFIFRNKKGREAYRIRLYLKQTNGKAWMFELLYDSHISINYWISTAMASQDIPNLSDWEPVSLPEDGSIPLD